MLYEKEKTSINPSVATKNIDNIQAGQRKEQKNDRRKSPPPPLKTVSMPELYDAVYASRPPVIDGLLYPGTYILAGALLEIAGRDQPDQKLHLNRDEERLVWTLEKAEKERWKEPPDPLLEAVATLVNADTPEWRGTATALASALGADMKPNTLAMRLNVTAGRLFNDHGVRYKNTRSHAGRQIVLRYEPPEA